MVYAGDEMFLFFLVTITAVATVFFTQNTAPVTITSLSWKFEASLALIVFLSCIAGLVSGSAEKRG